jgi:carboxyl-terminal processing protease
MGYRSSVLRMSQFTCLFGCIAIIVLFLLPINLEHHANAQTGRYRLSSLYYLSKIAFLVSKNYVEQNQIDPNKMFREALNQIQRTVPSVMVRFHKNNKYVDVYVDQKHKRFKVPSLPMIFSVPYNLRSIFKFIEKNYHGDIEQRKIEFAAITGMLRTLDSHTSFLPPSFYQDMQMHTRGSFGGLGIVIQSRDGFLTVVSPMPDTPASRAGIRPLDRIVRIGDESTINMDLNDAVNRLRGEPGTKVEIWIQRKGISQPKQFILTRAIINVQSISTHLLPNNIAYIHIKNFQQDTTFRIRQALQQFRKQGKVRGLILDLRNNPGGLLTQSIQVADLFLDKGVIVTHAGGSSQREVHRAHRSRTEPKYPMAVLVNQGSASASEIVAGAIKNHNRGLIFGQRTYGKGTVQILYPIDAPRYAKDERSALKLTVAQYLTPGDISIQDIGIQPDIELRAVNIAENQVHFFGVTEERKTKELPKYLKGIHEKQESLFTISYFDSRSEKERIDEQDESYSNDKKFKMDFDIEIAHKMLSHNPPWQRMSFFEKIQNNLKQVLQEENNKIHTAFNQVGINWNSPKKLDNRTPTLSIKYRLLPSLKKGEQSPRGNMVQAGSDFRLQVTVRNNSPYPVYRVRAMTISNYWFLNRKEFVFGLIPANQSKTWTVDLKLPTWLPNQYHRIKLDIRSAYKEFKHREYIDLRIVGQPRPRYDFSYALELVSNKFEGDDQPGDTYALRVTARNSGVGPSQQAIGVLRNKMDGPGLFIQMGRIQFGTLQPGKHATGWFYFRVHPQFRDKTLDMQISIFDSELHTTATRQISFKLQPDKLKELPLASKWIKINEQMAWIYNEPDFQVARIAQVMKGTRLQAFARLGAFYQIRLPSSAWGNIDKRTPKRHRSQWFGWIAARDVLSTTSAPQRRYKPKIQLYWQAVTPEIYVQAPKYPQPVFNSNFILKGNIRNNVSLLDAYILVNGEKVFYRSLRNIPKLRLNESITLKPGINHILIVARENIQFSGYQSIYIYYDQKKIATSDRRVQPKTTIPHK